MSWEDVVAKKESIKVFFLEFKFKLKKNSFNFFTGLLYTPILNKFANYLIFWSQLLIFSIGLFFNSAF